MTALKERVESQISNSDQLSQNTQRILVVDDENSISELIATSLKFVGFDVRTASSGAQALQIAQEFKPHALILDVMLPDQNGFEVCRQIRSEGQNIGVLFLTAKDSVEDKIAGLTIGGDDYEVKRAGKLIDLSPTEFLLLRYLMINADRVVSKSQILDHVWQYDFRGDMGIVETYVSYLRKKIDIFQPPLIHTVRGVGYRLRLPASK
jgi:two-component system OmpR family response regulator